MCGIVGIINHKAIKNTAAPSNSNLNNAFDNMLWADQLRGVDGTGIMRLNQHHKVEWIKDTGSVATLRKHHMFNSMRNWVDAAFWTIGHNRAATKGKPLAENSHPFEAGKITLVHNGTLRYFPDKYEHSDPVYDVDSLALAKMISELGIVKAANEFIGAYACVWIDETDMSLNFARNHERPLSYVSFDGGIAIASEMYLAAWALHRNSIEPKEFFNFDVNTHYKILADDIKNIHVVEKYEPKIPKGYSKGWSGGYGTIWDYDEGGYVKPTNSDFYDKKQKDFHFFPKKRKEKFRSVQFLKTDAGVEYSINDDVCVQITGIKTAQKNKHYQYEGIISEAALSDVRHRVIGTTSMPYKDLQNLDRMYEAQIAAIMVSATGYYLINLKGLKPLDDVEGGDSDKEASKSVALIPHLPNKSEEKVSKECDFCGVWYPKEDIGTISSTAYFNGGQVIRIVQACTKCTKDISDDFSLFDIAHENKMRRIKAAAREGVL